MPKKRGLLLVMSGPSGVGKTSIVHELTRRFDAVFSVSATTRERTPSERDGVDYYFVSHEQFQRWIAEKRFLEYAQVFGRNCYGTPREPVERQLEQGKVVILDVDVQGAANVKKEMPDAFCVFILPPSEAELLRRLQERGREDLQAIARRFAEAQKEMEFAKSSGVYDAFVVNDDLFNAIDEVAALVKSRMVS
jgi:guanylate kinase